MQANERRLGNPDQRVIHLKIEERPHAQLAHLFQATGRPVGSRRGQRGERAAMPVRRECDVVLRRQQDLARRPIDGRHLPLNEEPDVLKTEPVVRLEEVDRRLRGSRGWS